MNYDGPGFSCLLSITTRFAPCRYQWTELASASSSLPCSTRSRVEARLGGGVRTAFGFRTRPGNRVSLFDAASAGFGFFFAWGGARGARPQQPAVATSTPAPTTRPNATKATGQACPGEPSQRMTCGRRVVPTAAGPGKTSLQLDVAHHRVPDSRCGRSVGLCGRTLTLACLMRLPDRNRHRHSVHNLAGSTSSCKHL